MMIIGREGADIEDGSVISKKEAGGGGGGTAAAAAAAVSSSSSWSRLKDPRIVRVSRAFGGKDRHSKVCTVRGLRDRRVRLSVPTAIQLYDLQDRLGLNQPSKVVDWLLDAAKHEIDELPPLQMPPNSSSGNFLTHHHHNFQPFMLASSNSHHHPPQLQRPMKITTNWDGDGDGDDDDNNHNSILRTKAKVEEEEEEDDDDRDDSATRESNLQEEEDNNNNNNNNRNSLSNNFFSSRNSSNGGLGLLNSISSSAHHQSQQQQQQQQQQQPTYSSMMRWDPSTLSLAQSHPAVTDDFHSNFNVLQQHQVLVYQPAAAGGIAAGHSYFPSHINDHYQPKPINFQMLMSSSSTNSVDNSNSLTHAPNEGTPFHSTTNFLPTAQKDGRK